jgi:pullulanase
MRPDATLYGEPWTGGGPTRFGKGAQKGLPIAVFNDDIRGAIRGDTDGTAPGFATGKGGTDDGIVRGVRGSIEGFAQEPTETINYASAHDNLSLVDKIAKSAPAADASARRAMQKLAIGIVLVAQGIPFIEGGSEMCRTKGGNHNSYEAGDAVNRFDWAAAQQCHDVSDWVAGMIALRKAHPAFRMDDDAEVRASVHMLDTRGTIAWTIDGAAAKDPARQLFVALNGDPVRKEVALPGGRWNILADGNASGTASLRTVMGKVELAPYSMVVAAQE